MLLTVSLHWVPRARQRLAMQARFVKKVLEAPAIKKNIQNAELVCMKTQKTREYS